jgi:hypothetical protein
MLRTFSIFIIVSLFGIIPVSSQEYSSVRLTKQELLDAGQIDIYFENFDFNSNIQVIGYEVSAFIPEGDFLIKVKGTNKFSEEVIDLISKLKRGRRIYFENIKVRLEDGTIRTLQPISVKVR